MDIRKSIEVLNSNEIKSILGLLNRLSWLKSHEKKYLDLISLCKTPHELDLINQLLLNFTIIIGSQLEPHLENIKNYIIDSCHSLPDSTKILAFADADKPDGSQFVIQAVKNQFSNYEGWSENNFSSSIVKVNEIKKNINNLFLIDDFVGTGETAARKIEYVRKILMKKNISDIKISMVFVASMNFAKQKLDSLGVDYFSSLWLKKGISEYFDLNVVQEKIDLMLELESRLAKEVGGRKLPSLGYGKSETLFSIERYNIPNNVFPVFWWPYEKDMRKRETVFRRL